MGSSWSCTLRRLLSAALPLLAVSCAAQEPGVQNERVYHCVATSIPVPASGSRAQDLPLEKLEYGDYRMDARPTVGRGSVCDAMRVPRTAYLRYRWQGEVIEKSFDLSSLNLSRLSQDRGRHPKTVEFYVDGRSAEVRLLTPVPGQQWTSETIAKD